MFPAVIWMYYSGDTLWATVLLVFTIIAHAPWISSYGRFSSAGAPTCRCC